MARYGVLTFFCLAATISYVQRNSVGVAESSIRRDLGLTEWQSGMMMSAFFLTYALLQLPSAWLSTRLGSRAALSLFSAVWSVLTGLMAVAQGAVSLIAARLGMGAAQAGVFPAATQSIAVWFPKTRRGFASGALGSFMSVGGFVGAMLTGVLIVQVGWRMLFVIYAVPGVLWAVAFYLWFRNDPAEHSAVNSAELALIRGPQLVSSADQSPPTPHEVAGAGNAMSTPWAAMLSSRAIWAIGGQQFFRAAGQIFFASWFATYLQQTRNVSIPSAGFMTALPVLAIAAGSMVGGSFTDWVYQRSGSLWLARQGVGAGSLVVCALLIVPAYFVANPMVAVALISCGSFAAAFAGPCAYAITIDLGGRHVSSVFAFMNMCGNIGATLFPLAVPPLVKAVGSWDSVLFLFAGIYVAAAMCWVLFDSKRSIA